MASNFQNHVSLAEHYLQEYDEIQNQIISISDECEQEYQNRGTFESDRFNEISRAQMIISKYVNKIEPQQSVSNNLIRLLQIHLPHFSGDISQWLEFKAILFEDVIHDNEYLNSKHKSHYLVLLKIS